MKMNNLQRQRYVLWLIAVLSILLFFSCGRKNNGMKIPLLNNTKLMKEELFRITPAGSKAGELIDALKRSRFTVQKITNSNFMESDLKSSQLYEKIDYYYAILERSKGLLISETWQIAIVIDQNDSITNILISYGLTGL